ncbi:PIG-L family deacetylase [Subtercola boreus]|uniref:GlcNAc-PI de-N-acetylase n=1 Tax=Subtercola boreus TaxID=120213 RepID=A0A3E0W9P2_9MICO|nr:PIG-L family deacetylase [Subtercola boreus]RFA18237.1 hypothetical protein B7R23_14370 [Subtercola boreus]RFA18629.1 hypothetical protein B7R24_14330 [Subtercola boreus]RFA25233.1 hypothetical protein B7R25_14365 [Subtercola boreus]
MLFFELDGQPGAAVLLLHAHPDDETLATGGLMATLARRGYRVVLVTGTRGERGEVVPGPLKHLEGTDDLAAVRVEELRRAMLALGVTDHRLLGEASARAAGLAPRTYSDSGMQWGPHGSAIAADDAPADALSRAPLEEIAADVLAVVLEVAPLVIVSYDERGGYGHPDHVRMHDVAVEVAGFTGIPLYTIVAEWDGGAPLERDAFAIPLGPYRALKFAALREHATQLTVKGPDVVLSGGQRHTIADDEVFRLYEPPVLRPVARITAR